MFYASTGTVPEIFVNKEIPLDWFKNINVNNKIQRIFFRDVLDTISEGSHSAELHYSAANNYWKKAATKARFGNYRRFKQHIKRAVKLLLISPLKKIGTSKSKANSNKFR